MAPGHDDLAALLRARLESHAEVTVEVALPKTKLRLRCSAKLEEELRRFFHPFLEWQRTGAAEGVEIGVVEEEDAFSRVGRWAAKLPGIAIPSELNRDTVYSLRLATAGQRALAVLEDPYLETLYAHAGRRTVFIVGKPNSKLLVAVFRVIRDLWMRDALAEGALLVHASCLEKEHRGIVLLGHKRAGKTTALLNLATRKGYNLVANDRVLLTSEAQAVSAAGVPTWIRLRAESVRSFPALRHLSGDGFLTIHDLARRLGVSVTNRARICTGVILTYCAEHDRPVHRRLRESEAWRGLQDHRFPWEYARYLERLSLVSDERPRVDPDPELPSRGGWYELSTSGGALEETAELLDRWCRRQAGRRPGE